MFGFRKRKNDLAKQEALEIGNRLVERFNLTLSTCRENDLEARRTMLDQMFAERLTGLEPTDELSFEMLAEIEALALTKNWFEQADKYADEFMSLLSEDDVDCIRVIGIEENVRGHVWRNIEEVSALLEEDLNRTILEALERRGETPTP